ncbi:carboxymuconolactone decarboxylase family protein [Streptomyces sp. NPDC051014]|uniref:carboxymuconolactone decarboxylase family protein n=1 Tax=Streptomyces sp. NPDC051014 TaxID=3155751 RepID=UPI0033E6018B
MQPLKHKRSNDDHAHSGHPGRGSRRVREHLALSSAENNRCSYCLSAHRFLAKNGAKMDETEISMARDAGVTKATPPTSTPS